MKPMPENHKSCCTGLMYLAHYNVKQVAALKRYRSAFVTFVFHMVTPFLLDMPDILVTNEMITENCILV